MKLGVLSESNPRERRVALVPSVVAKLVAAGHSVIIEQGAGLRAGFDDEMFRSQGATLASRAEVLAQSDCLLRVAVPTSAEINELRSGQSIVSYIYPRRHPDVLQALASMAKAFTPCDASACNTSG